MAYPTPYSYREYTGDGIAKDFSVPFPYLLRAHVHVYLDTKELTEGTDFTWTSDTQIQLTTAPQALVPGVPPAPDTPAEVLTVQRITPEDDQIVQWQDGSYIIAEDLNESDLQWLYLLQEHHDWLIRGQNNLPGLPGSGGNTGRSSQFWNQLARHLDPDKDTAKELAATVDTVDQKTPDATGLKSVGWLADDKHVATTGAISERLDVIMSDTKPPDPPITEIRQPGKLWVDTSLLQISYWDTTAKAWVNLGSSGPQGPSGTVTVGTTTTLPAGSSATVSNSGTASAAVLDFGIPKGDQGIKGDTGLQGPQGLVGPTGPTGAQGAQGPQGPQGSIGPQGVKGDVGPTGATGPQGLTGNAGPQGIQGPAGPQGTTGPTGPQGQDGTSFIIKGNVPTEADLPAGATPGDSYFVTATGHAFSWNGTNWIDIGHLVGPQGPIGPQGPQGPAGPQGTQGVQGIKGDRGLQGVAGAAATVAVGTTREGATAGVTNSGTTSAAVFDFTIPRGDKGDKGDKGDTGADGTGVTIKGTVADAASLPTTGNTDGDMWLTANDGHGHVWSGSSFTDVGQIQGPQGPKGDKGDTGATGANGAAATIAVGTVTDGTTGSVTNSGTADAAVLDFVLPKGDKGDKGDQGPQGPAGAQGPTGPQGQKGDAGTGLNVKGSVANAAALPPTGNAAGDAYVTANDGHMHVWDPANNKWNDIGKVQGPTGPQGPAGSQGPAGAVGPAGPAGPAGPKGDKGDAGTQGVKGDAGATGAQGPKGDKGDAGAQGVKGDAGAQGATGAQGPKGDKGDAGAQGAQGAQGAKGDKGDTGPAGPTTQATEAALGAAEIATQAETTAGTDDLRFVTPKKLKVELDKKVDEAHQFWQRSGTEISPKTAGDDISTTGDVSAADATFTGLAKSAGLESSADVKIGGTLPASPNIKLNVNGTATFALAVTSNSFVALENSTSNNRSHIYYQNILGDRSLATFVDWGNNTGEIFSQATGIKLSSIKLQAPVIYAESSRLVASGDQSVHNLRDVHSGNYLETNGTNGAKGITYDIGSDRNLKENISPSLVNSTGFVDSVEFVSFDWKDKAKSADRVQLGVIAQQIQELDPTTVGRFSDDTLFLKQHELLMHALKGLQESNARIEALEAEVTALKGANP